MNSHEKFGHLVGMSRGQIQRILNGTALPPSERLDGARAKLKRLFGVPDAAAIRSFKRIKAIATLLPALGQHPTAACGGLNGFNAYQVELLTHRLAVPDHSILSEPTTYHEWLNEQGERIPTATQEDVNATGHFFAVREHLKGFEERLFEDALTLARSEANDRTRSDAVSLLTAMKGIELTIDSFRLNHGDAARVRRDLSSFLGTASVRQVADDEAVIAEFCKPWGLSVGDFRSQYASMGYLVMHSNPLRTYAAQVLSYSV